MSGYTNLLEEVLEAWEDTRLGIIDEIRNIPGEQWDFRPSEDVRSVRELVVHILEVAMMMTGELLRPDTNLRRAPFQKLLQMYAKPAYEAEGKAELQKLLRTQLREATRRFRFVGELHMLQLIERFDGEKGTRLAWLNHAIAQEMYHRGQLTVYERMLGIEPALTRRIRQATE